MSDTPTIAVFTKNLVVAAPVEVARNNLRAGRGKARAWLINAGNANCATRTGEQVALECVRPIAPGPVIRPVLSLFFKWAVRDELQHLELGRVDAVLPKMALERVRALV